jgi:LysM repeat protein
LQAAFLVSATNSGRTLLGSPAKHARPRFAHRLPGAAVPALVGAAAAFALAGAPAASASAAQVPAHHTAATTAAKPAGITAARLLSVTRPAAQNSAAAAKYTVKSGDTLSAIAEQFYQNPAYWPVLYWANHSQIKYANMIQVGQVLTVPAKPATIPGAPSVLGPSAPAPAPSTASYSAPVSYEQSSPVQTESAPVQQAAPVQAAASTVSTAGDSSFQSCVIAAESGGNAQVMNASGHYGLYQFSASTWAEYGGNPADFGNASAAEQNQVFDNAIAAGGQSNWAPYDGC